MPRLHNSFRRQGLALPSTISAPPRLACNEDENTEKASAHRLTKNEQMQHRDEEKDVVIASMRLDCEEEDLITTPRVDTTEGTDFGAQNSLDSLFTEDANAHLQMRVNSFRDFSAFTLPQTTSETKFLSEMNAEDDRGKTVLQPRRVTTVRNATEMEEVDFDEVDLLEEDVPRVEPFTAIRQDCPLAQLRDVTNLPLRQRAIVIEKQKTTPSAAPPSTVLNVDNRNEVNTNVRAHQLLPPPTFTPLNPLPTRVVAEHRSEAAESSFVDSRGLFSQKLASHELKTLSVRGTVIRKPYSSINSNINGCNTSMVGATAENAPAENSADEKIAYVPTQVWIPRRVESLCETAPPATKATTTYSQTEAFLPAFRSTAASEHNSPQPTLWRRGGDYGTGATVESSERPSTSNQTLANASGGVAGNAASSPLSAARWCVTAFECVEVQTYTQALEGAPAFSEGCHQRDDKLAQQLQDVEGTCRRGGVCVDEAGRNTWEEAGAEGQEHAEGDDDEPAESNAAQPTGVTNFCQMEQTKGEEEKEEESDAAGTATRRTTTATTTAGCSRRHPRSQSHNSCNSNSLGSCERSCRFRRLEEGIRNQSSTASRLVGEDVRDDFFLSAPSSGLKLSSLGRQVCVPELRITLPWLLHTCALPPPVSAQLLRCLETYTTRCLLQAHPANFNCASVAENTSARSSDNFYFNTASAETVVEGEASVPFWIAAFAYTQEIQTRATTNAARLIHEADAALLHPNSTNVVDVVPASITKTNNVLGSVNAPRRSGAVKNQDEHAALPVKGHAALDCIPWPAWVPSVTFSAQVLTALTSAAFVLIRDVAQVLQRLSNASRTTAAPGAADAAHRAFGQQTILTRLNDFRVFCAAVFGDAENKKLCRHVRDRLPLHLHDLSALLDRPRCEKAACDSASEPGTAFLIPAETQDTHNTAGLRSITLCGQKDLTKTTKETTTAAGSSSSALPVARFPSVLDLVHHLAHAWMRACFPALASRLHAFLITCDPGVMLDRWNAGQAERMEPEKVVVSMSRALSPLKLPLEKRETAGASSKMNGDDGTGIAVKRDVGERLSRRGAPSFTAQATMHDVLYTCVHDFVHGVLHRWEAWSRPSPSAVWTTGPATLCPEAFSSSPHQRPPPQRFSVTSSHDKHTAFRSEVLPSTVQRDAGDIEGATFQWRAHVNYAKMQSLQWLLQHEPRHPSEIFIGEESDASQPQMRLTGGRAPERAESCASFAAAAAVTDMRAVLELLTVLPALLDPAVLMPQEVHSGLRHACTTVQLTACHEHYPQEQQTQQQQQQSENLQRGDASGEGVKGWTEEEEGQIQGEAFHACFRVFFGIVCYGAALLMKSDADTAHLPSLLQALAEQTAAFRPTSSSSVNDAKENCAHPAFNTHEEPSRLTEDVQSRLPRCLETTGGVWKAWLLPLVVRYHESCRRTTSVTQAASADVSTQARSTSGKEPQSCLPIEVNLDVHTNLFRQAFSQQVDRDAQQNSLSESPTRQCGVLDTADQMVVYALTLLQTVREAQRDPARLTTGTCATEGTVRNRKSGAISGRGAPSPSLCASVTSAGAAVSAAFSRKRPRRTSFECGCAPPHAPVNQRRRLTLNTTTELPAIAATTTTTTTLSDGPNTADVVSVSGDGARSDPKVKPEVEDEEELDSCSLCSPCSASSYGTMSTITTPFTATKKVTTIPSPNNNNSNSELCRENSIPCANAASTSRTLRAQNSDNAEWLAACRAEAVQWLAHPPPTARPHQEKQKHQQQPQQDDQDGLVNGGDGGAGPSTLHVIHRRDVRHVRAFLLCLRYFILQVRQEQHDAETARDQQDELEQRQRDETGDAASKVDTSQNRKAPQGEQQTTHARSAECQRYNYLYGVLPPGLWDGERGVVVLELSADSSSTTSPASSSSSSLTSAHQQEHLNRTQKRNKAPHMPRSNSHGRRLCSRHNKYLSSNVNDQKCHREDDDGEGLLHLTSTDSMSCKSSSSTCAASQQGAEEVGEMWRESQTNAFSHLPSSSTTVLSALSLSSQSTEASFLER